MTEIIPYSPQLKSVWDTAVGESRNGLFQHMRDYMDYHSDRFKDHSLMFYKENTLIAILPLNEKKGCLYSHGGLTYGGFICGNDMKQSLMIACMNDLVNYMQAESFSQLIYKSIPYILEAAV